MAMEMSNLEQSTKHVQTNIANDEEHRKQLLLEVLRHRGKVSDSLTGRVFNDKSDIGTLFSILQKGKDKDKKDREQEALLGKTRSPTYLQIQENGFIDWSWRVVFTSGITWLLFLASNPFTGWCWGPILNGF